MSAWGRYKKGRNSYRGHFSPSHHVQSLMHKVELDALIDIHKDDFCFWHQLFWRKSQCIEVPLPQNCANSNPKRMYEEYPYSRSWLNFCSLFTYLRIKAKQKILAEMLVIFLESSQETLFGPESNLCLMSTQCTCH